MIVQCRHCGQRNRVSDDDVTFAFRQASRDATRARLQAMTESRDLPRTLLGAPDGYLERVLQLMRDNLSAQQEPNLRCGSCHAPLDGMVQSRA
jgi:hypothetical protein